MPRGHRRCRSLLVAIALLATGVASALHLPDGARSADSDPGSASPVDHSLDLSDRDVGEDVRQSLLAKGRLDAHQPPPVTQASREDEAALDRATPTPIDRAALARTFGPLPLGRSTRQQG